MVHSSQREQGIIVFDCFLADLFTVMRSYCGRLGTLAAQWTNQMGYGPWIYGDVNPWPCALTITSGHTQDQQIH